MIKGVKRISSWSKYSAHVKQGQTAFIGLKITSANTETLQKIGFPPELTVGLSICPSTKFGPVSRFNAKGKEVPQRDMPKESYFQEVYREWKDWHGTTHFGYYDVERKRFPRRLISPPSEFLNILEHDNEKFIVAGESFTQGITEESSTIHKVNLFLELFGEADILDENMCPFVIPKLVRVNWEILPAGEWPWTQSKNDFKSEIQGLPKSSKKVMENRLQVLSQFNPSFVAQGVNGYNGYLVFAFPHKNLYMLESPFYGNATYVFEGDWESLSQFTKAQILASNKHKQRIVHSSSWVDEIKKILL